MGDWRPTAATLDGPWSGLAPERSRYRLYPLQGRAMKINGNEIRPGMMIEYQNGLWIAVKAVAVKPGKGPAYNQVELKNIVDGRKLNNRFGSDEKVEQAR